MVFAPCYVLHHHGVVTLTAHHSNIQPRSCTIKKPLLQCLRLVFGMRISCLIIVNLILGDGVEYPPFVSLLVMSLIY